MKTLCEHAQDYLGAGLAVLPARLAEKRPALSRWKKYQQQLPSAAEVQAWFANTPDALCLLTGAVSGQLEIIDFDLGGELFAPWVELVQSQRPALLARLVIEQSQNGGRHVAYRCAAPVSGNLKLAQRLLVTPDGQEITLTGKRHKPRRVGDHFEVLLTLIETRGQGGLFLCHPSPGYTLVQGAFTALPVITAEERELLLEAAWALNEVQPPAAQPEPNLGVSGRPGDAFNEQGDVRALLIKHGWQLARPGDNEYWRRPGKDAGWSATLKNRVFYVFSANAAPFAQDRAYGPFAVYALLEHTGDFAQAAAALRLQGFGQEATTGGVDVSGILVAAEEDDEEEATAVADPGPLPEELLRVPGLVSEVMDYTLQTAQYPEPTLAFAGALALQALLAGRKVRDEADNRTNLYLLGLANSGAGKDHPRKVNQRILVEVGLADCLGNAFASGEGLEDRLFLQPGSLFQVDEMDSLLLRVNLAKDARHEQIVSILLQMYSSANGVYVMRAKAGKDRTVIDQPCLCLFGTAVPKQFYAAISTRMMTNGFLARMLILECHKRGRGRDVPVRPLPGTILNKARWWADFRPGTKTGNLSDWHPVPQVVEQATAAAQLLRELRERADDAYTQAESANDAVAMAIWARAYEKARRLALVYACSADHTNLHIAAEAARWASAFVEHQTRRMLFMAGCHASESDFDAKRKRLLEVLHKWQDQHGDRWMPFWMINRKLPWTNREHEEVRETLVAQRLIEARVNPTGGRPGAVYRLTERAY